MLWLLLLLPFSTWGICFFAWAFCHSLVRIEVGQFSLHRDPKLRKQTSRDGIQWPLRLVLLLQLVQLLLCSLFHGTSGFPRQPHECWKTVPAFELLDFLLELLAGPGDPATLATLIPAVYSRHFPLRGAKDCRHSCRCCFCLWTNFDLTEGYSNCGVDSEASCLSA